MKLIYCKSCKDIIKLYSAEKSCHCGKSSGGYIDEARAKISGPCIPFGLDNSAFDYAMKRPQQGLAFTGFVIVEGGRVKRK